MFTHSYIQNVFYMQSNIQFENIILMMCTNNNFNNVLKFIE